MAAWTRHPKITPFHLTFMFTTGGLGSAKAVLVSQGDTASSITVEWITGVVVALILQFLGSCEYSNSRPRWMDWYFHYGCFVTESDSRDVGLQSIDHQQTSRGEHIMVEPPPLVTGYRLLASIVFLSFGLTKTTCTYLGFSGAMNTLDWIIAVPLTLIVYYIGLYEEPKRSSPTWRKAFDVSYTSETAMTLQIAVILLMYMGSLALCGEWLKFWVGALRALFRRTINGPSQSDNGSPYGRFGVHGLSVTLCVAMLETGVLFLGIIISPVFGMVTSRRLRYYGVLVGHVAAYTFLATFLVGTFFMFLFAILPT